MKQTCKFIVSSIRQLDIYILIVLLFGLITACNKDNEHPIPNVPVYVEPMFIYDAEYNELLNMYGKVTISDVGFQGNGVIVINVGYDDAGGYKFMAYDATCTHEIKKGCIVQPDKNSISLIKCSCCGSKYEVTYGAVNEGPSNYPLKTYKTTFNGEYLRVYN